MKMILRVSETAAAARVETHSSAASKAIGAAAAVANERGYMVINLQLNKVYSSKLPADYFLATLTRLFKLNPAQSIAVNIII